MSKFILISATLFAAAFGLSKISYNNVFLLQHNNVRLKHKNSSDSFPFKINAIAPYIDYFNDGEYFFNKWVKGSVVSSNNIEISNDTYFYNYDKISNNLLLTTDLKEIIEIDKREFKAFLLKDGSNEYHFEHMPVIDNKFFFQVLVKNDRYSLYKRILVKRKKKEGFTNTFWELSDAYFYYVVFPNGRFYKKINLKR
ncbi:MAG TPA: hypothetical protein VHZ50_06550, partial [Puia sp.]|nr:hypothetical protein [Puia sp.]